MTSGTTRRRLLAAMAASTTLARGPTTAAAEPAAARMENPVQQPSGLFRSFFMAGFECSSHRRADGRRLDLIAATRHDELAAQDYRQIGEHGLATVRDGVRWHLVEGGSPGAYDWSSLLPMLRAAEAAGIQVAWDLCHYGWPDGLDVFSAAFPERLGHYAGAFARLHLHETGRAPVVCPVNEMSYLAWAGGDAALMNPGTTGRGLELKRQLVRATIAAIHAVREASPAARILAIEPLVHVVPRAGDDPGIAERHAESQSQACDMLAGQQEPGLGGEPGLLDLIGANYYWNNQWEHRGVTLSAGDARRRPLSELLGALHARYERPIFVAETSIEGHARAAWLRHVGKGVRDAVLAGVPIEGICLYPVLSHPGWDDGRYCPNGLLEMEPVADGRRPVHAPLADELRRQRGLFTTLFAAA